MRVNAGQLRDLPWDGHGGPWQLARAINAAGMEWNADEAHSAVYDTEQTARLFCKIANAWPKPV